MALRHISPSNDKLQSDRSAVTEQRHSRFTHHTFFSHRQIPCEKGRICLSDIKLCFPMSHLISHLSCASCDGRVKSRSLYCRCSWSYSHDARVSGGTIKLDISFNVDSILRCMYFYGCFPKNNLTSCSRIYSNHRLLFYVQLFKPCSSISLINLWDDNQHQHRSDLHIISSQV